MKKTILFAISLILLQDTSFADTNENLQIYNGTDAKGSPYVTSMFILENTYQINENKTITYSCSSTLISGNMLLTAAHCFLEYKDYPLIKTRILIPTSNFFVVDINNSSSYKVLDQDDILAIYIKNEAFEYTYHDIALIQLRKSLDTTFYKPVRLSQEPVEDYRYDQVYIFGYGGNKNVSEPTVDNPDGFGILRYGYSYVDGSSYLGYLFMDFSKGNNTFCPGDSGGAVFKPGGGEMLAVITRGYCSQLDKKGESLSTYFYRKWITRSYLSNSVIWTYPMTKNMLSSILSN